MAQSYDELQDVRDVLLADIAVSIQLSPTDYRLAVTRVATLADWLDRDGSPLAGLVQLVYAQGSMAIHATIASCLRRDEFDIDAIAQIQLMPGTTPREGLDLLYRSLKGEPGSRYYAVTRRNTRCVTVDYAQMHIDITPAELIPYREPRVSTILHHRPEEPNDPGKRIVANPYGFAEWFNAVTPRVSTFEKIFEARSRAMDSVLVKDAEVEEVPAQIPAYLKSPTVVALQLMKRFRNLRYERRTGRRPPGVLLACRAASSARHGALLFDELLHQARSLHEFFAQHQAQGRLIHVANPRCPEDVLSDRWPANLGQQQEFAGDLRFLVSELEQLHNASLDKIVKIFAQLFGEEVSNAVMKSFVDRNGQSIASGRMQTQPSSGRVNLVRSGVIPAISAIPAVARAAAPRHTFYGPGASDDAEPV